jgi:hypothetical protein
MIYIIVGFYLATALIYGFHSFVSYLRDMEPYSTGRTQEFLSLIVFMASFEALLFPIFLSAEIVIVIKKDCEYIKTPWKA